MKNLQRLSDNKMEEWRMERIKELQEKKEVYAKKALCFLLKANPDELRKKYAQLRKVINEEREREERALHWLSPDKYLVLGNDDDEAI